MARQTAKLKYTLPAAIPLLYFPNKHSGCLQRRFSEALVFLDANSAQETVVEDLIK